MTGVRLAPRDAAALTLVAAIWGFNFVVMKLGLERVPPLFLSGLRFTLVAALLPFVPRPAVPRGLILRLGLTLGLFAFSMMFFAVKAGISVGVASVLMQTHVFFTIAAAALLFGERVTRAQALGLALGAAGVALLAVARDGAFTLAGFVLALAAAMGQAGGNLIMREAKGASALGLVVWMSLPPILPLFTLSALFEGPERWREAIAGFDATAAFALVYLAFLSMGLSYAIWGWALARLPAAQVTPFALLAPVFGLAGGALAFGERPGALTLIGAGLMIAGLLLAVLGPSLVRPATRGR